MEPNREKKLPIGGASLECLMAYECLGMADIKAIVSDGKLKTVMQLRRFDPFVSADPGFAAFHSPQVKTIGEFLNWLQGRNDSVVVFNYVSRFVDIDAPVSLGFYLNKMVIQISTPEDVIWAFSHDAKKATSERLDAFYKICEIVGSIRAPNYAAIGSEPCHVEEITMKNSTCVSRERYERGVFFSESRKQELFEWYTNVYVKRWDG